MILSAYVTQHLIQEEKLTFELAPRECMKQQVIDMLHSQAERRQMCGEILSESVIETVDHKRQAHDKEARLAMVQVCIYV